MTNFRNVIKIIIKKQSSGKHILVCNFAAMKLYEYIKLRLIWNCYCMMSTLGKYS